MTFAHRPAAGQGESRANWAAVARHAMHALHVLVLCLWCACSVSCHSWVARHATCAIRSHFSAPMAPAHSQHERAATKPICVELGDAEPFWCVFSFLGFLLQQQRHRGLLGCPCWPPEARCASCADSQPDAAGSTLGAQDSADVAPVLAPTAAINEDGALAIATTASAEVCASASGKFVECAYDSSAGSAEPPATSSALAEVRTAAATESSATVGDDSTDGHCDRSGAAAGHLVEACACSCSAEVTTTGPESPPQEAEHLSGRRASMASEPACNGQRSIPGGR